MLSSISETQPTYCHDLAPPPPARPPPRPPDSREALLQAVQAGVKGTAELERCSAVVAFEFSHTASYEPGPTNWYIAYVALQLWHGPLRQRHSAPILAPPRLARALHFDWDILIKILLELWVRGTRNIQMWLIAGGIRIKMGTSVE